MIDDAISELTARFVRHDSTEENIRLLWAHLERNGRLALEVTSKRRSCPVESPRELTETERQGILGVM